MQANSHLQSVLRLCCVNLSDLESNSELCHVAFHAESESFDYASIESIQLELLLLSECKLVGVGVCYG
jgi:hypothetical protein